MYKKIYKACGGGVLYIDKKILKHLNINYEDEVKIEFEQDKIIITKPIIGAQEIQDIVAKIKG